RLCLKMVIGEMVSRIQEKIKNKLKGQVKKEFKDTAAHWARNDIARAQALGLMNGYEDGLFKPEAPINSVEAMVVAVRLAETVTGEVYGDNPTSKKLTGDAGKSLAQFPDWAKAAAQKALASQMINLNRFHSQVQATRAQVAVMLARALGLQPVQPVSLVFKDAVLLSKEDAGYIIALYEAGVVKGTPDGRFNPNSAITRAEFAALLARLTSVVEEKLGIEEDDVQESNEQNNEQNQPVSEQTGEQAGEQAGEQ
ncbi:MAG: S-layer homology domain-containing protein, partial [Desulfurispora sp.]|uniref:S-layer homology domain-containing protein n=1 Tax=Desulfurispora sp. TaxID=3014275 RepID=UPI00404A9BC9